MAESISVEELKRRKALKRRRQRKMQLLQEKREMESAKGDTLARLWLALVLFGLILIASIGWNVVKNGEPLIAWIVSFFSSFTLLRLTTASVIITIVTAALFNWPFYKLIGRQGKLSKYAARTKSLLFVGLTILIGVGIVIPSMAWHEAYFRLPVAKFNACVRSLNNDDSSVLAINDGNNGKKYATVVTTKGKASISKYALEPNEDGGWNITDMITNKRVENLPNC